MTEEDIDDFVAEWRKVLLGAVAVLLLLIAGGCIYLWRVWYMVLSAPHTTPAAEAPLTPQQVHTTVVKSLTAPSFYAPPQSNTATTSAPPAPKVQSSLNAPPVPPEKKHTLTPEEQAAIDSLTAPTGTNSQ